jgi:hypothetical protein
MQYYTATVFCTRILGCVCATITDEVSWSQQRMGWGVRRSKKHKGEISGSYGGKYEDGCHLGCCAV